MNPEYDRIYAEGNSLWKMGVKPSVKMIPEWQRWGPYVTERGWGGVREDYSANGDPWNYFPHDHAHLRAYRRSEDGIAAISDWYQVLLFAPVFWNGNDPILKERLFGVNGFEGNHGEDVKELYYYLDATPTHSYLKYLYKYPHKAYPYNDLIQVNSRRSFNDLEYELIDTGVLNENRYFDIFVEYAKEGPYDLCIKIEAFNRGPESAPLHILPHLWFRNQWSWWEQKLEPPIIKMDGENCLVADDSKLPSLKHLLFDYRLGPQYLYGSEGAEALFTENDSNNEALWKVKNDSPHVKDAFHRYLIKNEKEAVNPKKRGSKAAFHYFFKEIPAGKSAKILLRLTNKKMSEPLRDVEKIIAKRIEEADIYYDSIHPKTASQEEKMIQRQALAGMIWNKQFYYFDVGSWLDGDNPKYPPPESRKQIRNFHWRHVISMRILSMPDKWEFPWFAAWDLCFHTISFALLDIEFAKQQLWLLLFDQFQHPNGAIPAYEWEFSDVNPPVQGWAALKIYEIEKEKHGREDYMFMEKCFHKLLLNFAWWVNKVDSLGHNIFEGGFLGMDNIGFADRSEKLQPGFLMDQSDGSGWMSILCLNLTRMALILAKKNPVYESLGIKFFQHFVYVTAAMRKGYWRNYDLWSEEDGFFYSALRHPDGSSELIKVRSLCGIIPFFACDVWDEEELKKFPTFYAAFIWFMENKGDLTDKCVEKIGGKFRFGLLDSKEMSQFLTYLWDPNEFRSEFGLRSLSKYHEKNPARMGNLTLFYEPGESKEKIKGGNSNWRGPIWIPFNYMLIETLMKLSSFFKDTFKVNAPNQESVTLHDMAKVYAESVLKIFKKDKNGKRPMFGMEEKYKDPHFQDYLFFNEHFHGDNGRGLGASHQNGWTGLVANLIDEFWK